MKTITKRESYAINYLKAIAILSAISAHTNKILYFNDVRCSITVIWRIFATAGVISFFIIGGYLYTRTPGDTKSFWHKKFKRLVIPWLLCGSITYIVSLLRVKAEFDGFIKWVFGFGTWYYYIVVYIVLLFLFKYLSTKNCLLYMCLIVNVCMVVLTSIYGAKNASFYMWGYLNPLNWVGYFSLGVLLRKSKNTIYSVPIFILSGVLMCFTYAYMYVNFQFGYFHLSSIIGGVSSFFFLINICYYFGKNKYNIWNKIGQSSYFIYLLHMQIVQFVNNRVPNGIVKAWFSPIIGLIVMMMLVYIISFICNKSSKLDRIKEVIGL